MRYFFVLFISASSLFSLPQGLEVIQGDALSHRTGNQLQIHAADAAILHWKEFSIASSERVQFIQPSSASAVLNRVQGEYSSRIDGHLCANGKVYLINPHGVIFGRDATILVSSLFVSTLDCSDAAFSCNQDLLFQGDSREAIINYGVIKALDGDIALLGRVIENRGSLTASRGSVFLTAGQEILIRPEASPILTIRPAQNKEGVLKHTGTIEALAAELQAEGQAYLYGINIEGTVLALKTVREGGRIYLKSEGVSISPSGRLEAPQGRIEVETGEKGLYTEGTISAEEGTLLIHQESSSPSPSFQLGTLDVGGPQGGSICMDVAKLINHGKISAEGGGSIAIRTEGAYIETSQGVLSTDGALFGGTLSIESNTSLFSSGSLSSKGDTGGEIFLASPIIALVSANINASGNKRGGKIQIGALPHVQTIHIGGDTSLSVSSKQHGDGGQILISSEQQTVCYGSMEARGGPLGGNGGKIEVSGENGLGCYASLSASAPVGIGGKVFFDPKNIVIDIATGVYPQYALIDPSALGTGFGTAVAVLSTGNIVVTKPSDSTAAAAAGAVYLYNGLTAALISTALGSTASDQIGSGGITTLTDNGNYVFVSTNWDNGAVNSAGAVTWGSGSSGVTGAISASNSLVGSSTSDQVGSSGVTALPSGNYVVRSPNWDNGAVNSAGAVTWGSGTSGVAGVISASNSLVGSTASDSVGGTGITVLTNGNYVVRSSNWDSGVVTNVGAVTWGSGASGVAGAVSASNSLIGSTTNDMVGSAGITTLTNGNYVVRSSNWDSGVVSNVGAVTWGNGTTGITGVVSASNSLVGSTASDAVGSTGVTALTNGNYVVRSSSWDNGAVGSAGAATWGDGTSGITGAVSAANSLVGSTINDTVGSGAVLALENGNYVVLSPNWDSLSVSSAGAATWGNGATGTTGAVTESNSLFGSTSTDQVGNSGAIALTNGNYVVLIPSWTNGGILAVGAVTWGDGVVGVTGAVSPSNSLVGSITADGVGNGGCTPLTNGNYVVASTSWDNGGVINAGAVTWGDGTTGITGAVNSGNSLVGSTASDQVGSGDITALDNGNYVVVSPNWDNGIASNAGAVTWGNGTTGITGAVSAGNSLVGSATNDLVGNTGITVLTNGNYIVRSASWDNGAVNSAGAVTWGSGTTGITGAVSASNSLVGSTASDQVGVTGVTVLANDNYVVRSALWDNGAVNSAGAVTWGSGTSGVAGAVSASNSLVGSTASDQIGSGGVTALANGNYVVLSPLWDNGGSSNAGAASWGDGSSGTVGIVSVQNSIAGPIASGSLQSPSLDDAVNGTFVVRFTGGVGYVLAGLQNPNQMTFARAQAQTMTIPPAFITDALNEGTSVILQANNDFTLSSPLVSSGTGDLTVLAGRSIEINANITLANASLTLTANDLLASGIVDAYRDAGDAVLSIGNNVVIDTGTGDLNLSLLDGEGKTNYGSGDLTIGDQTTLQCSGAGAMTLLAEQNNVVLGSNAILQTADGDLMVTAGVDISAANPISIRTTGGGQMTLIVDNLFPTSPLFGNGSALFPQATLTTGGGKLLIYTSERSLNSVPSTINGVAYVPGPETFNSATEKWGVYYPSSSGIPFTIFYKTPAASPTPPAPPAAPAAFASHAMYTAIVSPFQDWLNFWNKDAYLGKDPFPPFTTPKGFFLHRVP